MQDFHEAVKKCPPYQLFYPKKHAHVDPLHIIIVVVPFSKLEMDFMHFMETSTEGMVISL